MGNAQSNIVFRKLSKELPNNYWKYTEAGKSVFADDDDREQFIYAVIAVATNNGVTNLEDYDFKLLYSRRASNQERIIARIVAVKDGIIKAKIEPEVDGADQREAFLALKKDVEIKLDRILQAVPRSPSDAGPAGRGRAETTADAPPAYSSPAVGIADRKKG